MYQLDQAQSDTHQGPCLDALYNQQTVRLSDMDAETRWPKFSRRAVELGVGSMLCLQLYVEQDDLGALNLQSRKKDAFNDSRSRSGCCSPRTPA